MEKRWIVHAYEGRYYGKHSMEEWFVCRGISKEIEEEAVVAAIELQENYSCISEANVEEACERVGIDCPNYGNSEFLAELHDIILENCIYSIWEVDPECGLSDEELQELLYNDPKETIDNYTVAEM